MSTPILKRPLERLLLVVALVATAARAEPDSFGLGSGRDGAFTTPAVGTVINRYTQVTGPLLRGDTTIPVASTTGFANGDLVMVLQTTGIVPEPASGNQNAVDITNAPVGQWELARLSGVSATELGLGFPLTRDHAAGVTQVIRVPEYTDVTVSSGRSIVAQPWDGSTGGVVAFLATGTVTNDGQIDVNGAGFRGGLFVNDSSTSTTCTGLDQAPPTGAQKGEGIAVTRYGPSSTGRGNVANGGGGGVCVKSGGGGGGNGGSGGRGGNSAASDGRRVVGGLGGAGVTFNMLNHLMMGGGGGTGHGKDDTGSTAGRGGGIVFIRANQLAGGGILSSNGTTGLATTLDGAGGGGAGGSIYLRLAGTSTCGGLLASGGIGSSVNATLIGPGGGGGGGRMLLQQLSGGCSTNVLGAAAGNQLNPSAPEGISYGALPGSNGLITTVTGGFTVPPTPVITAPTNGTVTTNARLPIIGTAQPNLVVVIYIDRLEVGRVTADAGGNWSFTPPTDYSEGAHIVQAATEFQAVQSPRTTDITFIVNLEVPDTIIVSGPSTTGTSRTATFDFDSTEPGVSFECSLDGAPFVPCSDPFTLPNVPDGTHTLLVRARDAAGEVDPTPASYTWTVDTLEPDTFFAVPPRPLTSPTNATFDFDSNESPVTYECSLDGNPFAPCSDPTTLGYQVGGSHTLQVRAKDASGNVDSTPASHTWTVDDVPPSPPVILSPTEGAVVDTPQPVIIGTAEPGATVEVFISQATMVLVGTVVADASGNWTVTSSVSYGDESFLYVQAFAIDPAGNRGNPSTGKNFRVDLDFQLDTFISGGPIGDEPSPEATFHFASNVADATYECSLDGGPFQACPNPYIFTVTPGPHTLLVRAKDSNGNVDGTPISREWNVLGPPLDTTIVSGPTSTVGTAEVTFDFSSNTAGVTYECSLDGGPFLECSDPYTLSVEPGEHTLQVRAKAADGEVDTTPASATWSYVVGFVLDTTIVSGPAEEVDSTEATFDFEANVTGVTYECSLDGGAFAACSDPYTLTAAPGTHVLRVRARDSSGNVDPTPATWAWTVKQGGGTGNEGDDIAFLGGNACSSAGGGSSLGVLGLLALAVLHARRRRRA